LRVFRKARSVERLFNWVIPLIWRGAPHLAMLSIETSLLTNN